MPKLVVQNKSLTPANGGREAKQADLQAGDILLSSGTSLNALSIRVSPKRSEAHPHAGEMRQDLLRG